MSENPFHYGTPVDGQQFTGREQELAALRARMRDGINAVLISPRRYGKTSLLMRAEEELARGDAAVVHLNVLRCRDVVDLAAKLAGTAFRLPGRWHRAKSAATDFAHRLRIGPNISLGPDGTPRFGFSTDLAPRDADAVIADVYGLLAEQADERPACLVLDEFQAVTDHGTHLPGELKALADEHPGVALVLAGSRAHLMERLTGSTGAPLYGMAERLALGPIDPEVMIAFLAERSAAGSRPMTEAVASLIIDRAGPVPNDIQRLAYGSFAIAERRVTAADVEAAVAEAVAHDSATFADAFARLPTGQRRVLLTVAAEPVDEPYAARFVRSVRLANAASVRKAITALSESDVLVMRDGRWEVGDPFFRAWLVAAGGD